MSKATIENSMYLVNSVRVEQEQIKARINNITSRKLWDTFKRRQSGGAASDNTSPFQRKNMIRLNVSLSP